MTSFAIAAYNTAREIKRLLPDSLIVMGGPHPTILPEEALQRGAEVVVRGEGEYTFLELVEKYTNYSNVRGISFIKEGKVVHNPDREYIRDMDELPLPARHLLKMEKYLPTPGNYKRFPATSMISYRGCPFRCTFCSNAIFGRVARMRSPEDVRQYIKAGVGILGLK